MIELHVPVRLPEPLQPYGMFVVVVMHRLVVVQPGPIGESTKGVTAVAGFTAARILPVPESTRISTWPPDEAIAAICSGD